MHNASDYGFSIAGQLPSAERGTQDISARAAGRQAWRDVFASGSDGALEFPRENPYGDEWDNPPAQAFRRGFDAAAREDGYTYSRIDGEYHEGGEYETDEFPEPGDVRECA
jgi:hypothetical protein